MIYVIPQGTKIRPLWGTAQLFMHPRYMHGGATRYTIDCYLWSYDIFICIYLIRKLIISWFLEYSPELAVYAYAAAQVKKAIDVRFFLLTHQYPAILCGLSVYISFFVVFLQVTHYLGGENYVFWGGRDGYQSLLNTDMERELNHLVNSFPRFFLHASPQNIDENFSCV